MRKYSNTRVGKSAGKSFLGNQSIVKGVWGIGEKMCQDRNSVNVYVKIPADLSHTGEVLWRDMPMDKCIASIVSALQKGGIDMRGSCCGHGRIYGEINLQDGRTILIKKGRIK